MQILVLGMHRSGTSLVARLLNMMGVYFAPEGLSTGANEENPKGFWERQDVRALNDALLHAAGADWHRLSAFSLDQIPGEAVAEFRTKARKIILAMDAHRPWFLKEPRFCLLAPLWLELLETPLCLLVYRSPLEVARSLEMRNHFSLAFGVALWERYTVAALDAIRGHSRLQVNHADILAAPIDTTRKLEATLRAGGMNGLRSPSDEEILAFIDPALYRAKELEIEFPQGLTPAQQALNHSLRSGSAIGAGEAPIFTQASQTVLTWEDALARHRKENVRLKERQTTLSAEVTKLRTRLGEADGKVAELTKKLRQVTAAFDTAQQNALTANELRKTIQHEMARLREAAQADATNAELQTRNAELAEARAQIARALSQLQAREREKTLVTTRLNGAIKRRDRALGKKEAELGQLQTQLNEMTKTLKAVRKGVSKIESAFDRLQQSRSFHFMVYSARRFGLVSRTPRRCLDEIARRLAEIHRALKGRGAAAPKEIPQAALRECRIQKSAPFVGLREFEDHAVARVTSQLAEPVAIVVPIYNSPDELRRCVESVFVNTRTPFQLILVDDCSPDPRIGELLAIYQARDSVRVIHSPANLGFVCSANLGMAATQHDVVLLNSDAEVTPRWLQKLTIAAYSDPAIATVTPFSNAAGAFSVPKMGVNAPIPFPFTVLKMARLTERLSARAYPTVPTGNGFCMFIKRAALEQVGGFDEENFGRGYGEENDFCMRAAQKGWRHVIDDSLFVYHRGNSSFGEEKQELLKGNRAILDRLHPSYPDLVRQFTSSPEINAMRARIGERLTQDVSDLQLEKPRLLYILQEGAGGVPMTNADLVSKISATHECHLLTSTGTEMILRAWENGQLVDKKQWKLPGTWSAKNYSSPVAQRIYLEVLTGLSIDLVHIRHLFKHSFDAPKVCQRLGIPVILSFHDYYFACPSIHLLDQNASYCGGECTPGLQQCTIPSPMLQDLPMLKPFLATWRSEVAKVLDCCDAFVTTAASVRELHQRVYPQIERKPFWVIEHGREFESTESVATAPQLGEPVRILVAGNIDLHKGSLLIRQLKELDREGLLEFHFLGQTDENLRDIGVHHGRYRREDFPSLARAIRPSFAAVFSIWAETFSHTLTEAWSVGLPVLGSQLGAVGERIQKYGGGWTVDTGSAAAVLTEIRQIVSDPPTYQEKVSLVAKIPLQKTDEMADGYRALYDFLLAPPAPKRLLRVGRIEPRGDRGSSFVRLRLPFAHEDMGRDVLATRLPPEIAEDRIEEWVQRLQLEAIIVQRDVLSRSASNALSELCQAEGIRLVFEIDDNLLEVDPSHAEFERYSSNIDYVKDLAVRADDVVVSTETLAAPFQRLNAQTRVIPNALDEWLWFSPVAASEVARREKAIVVGYMGTITHGADVELIREPFLCSQARLRRDHGLDLVLQMVGGVINDETNPWFERIRIPDGASGYPEFVRWLRQTLAWDMALAPLVDNPLNQSKSALKFFEYAALGLPGIFSAIGEYAAVIRHRDNGLLIFSNMAEEWEEAIVELASSPALRTTLRVNARRETQRQHLLRETIPIWKALLRIEETESFSPATPQRIAALPGSALLPGDRTAGSDSANEDDALASGIRLVDSSETQEAGKPTTILFVLHKGRGGTILTSIDLAANLPRNFRSLLLKTGSDSWSLAEFADGKMFPLRRFQFAKPWHVTEGLVSERREVLVALGGQYGIDLVHFRHLLANAPEAISTFQQAGAKTVFSFHDFYTICPTVQLIDGDGRFCGGPCTKGENDCPLPIGWIEPDFGRLRDAYVHTHRARMGAALAECDWFVTTSEASRNIILENMPEIPAERFSIIEHGRDVILSDVSTPPTQGTAARVVCFGALNDSKGLTMLRELLALNAQAGHPLEFHFLGNMVGSFVPEQFGGVRHGPYQRQELTARLVEIKPSFSLVASIWPETYCHTLTESWTNGLPVLASDIGTLRERVRRHGGGWLIDPHDARQWLAVIQRILAAPAEYDQRKAEVLAYRPRSIREMTNDYCAMYQRLLKPASVTEAKARMVD